MARKTECYVDVAAFIAFLDKSDSHHSLFRRLFSDPPPLATSALVLAEGHGWFLRRYDQRRALEFLNFVSELPALAIPAFDTDALGQSKTLLSKFNDHPLTLADAHGLVVMAGRRINMCWSTDWHMGLTGVTLVA
jgi:predicted nucleic acid-binding protein